MDSLLAQLKQRQEAFVHRGVAVASATRNRGLSTLGALRDGTLDWRATLEAHRRDLETRSPRWMNVRLEVVTRLDGFLDRLGERVRLEIDRLSKLELAAAATVASSPTPISAPVTAKQKPARAIVAKLATKAAKESKKDAAKTTRRLVMPIPNYDELTAKQILVELGSLTPAQCRTVLAHEQANKRRKTILKVLAAQLAAA